MIRTGIGGWTFPEWRGVFYPEGLRQKDELAYAAAHLGTIEINATFRRLQSPAIFARWRAATPDGFRFALKGSRYVVTRPHLADAGEAVQRFCRQGITELGDRLGPVLWQMPETRRFDPDDIDAFLRLLPREVEGQTLRHAIEAGHDSFACDEFVNIAARHHVAIAAVDDPTVPMFDAPTTDFVYVRLKNAQTRLKRGYPPQEVENWAERALAWQKDGRDVWLYCINGAKVRAPAAAMAIAHRISAA